MGLNVADQLFTSGGEGAVLKKLAAETEGFLSGALPKDAPRALLEPMEYSLGAGGKRLRPALCLAFASLCGLGWRKALPFACAIEMIHTYSLIHDDLPAMDDDDLRRGKPSCHKAFNEAAAILAGDGLLADAFALALTTPAEPAAVLKAARFLAAAAGSAGMAGGQMLDMEYTGAGNVTLEQIRHMQSLKTGAMIEASCACGAILAGADQEAEEAAAAYGRYLGRAYQVIDDILDITGDSAVMGKPAGSDEAKGKNTCPSAAGLFESARMARADGEKALDALSGFSGPEADFLRSLVDRVLSRCS